MLRGRNIVSEVKHSRGFSVLAKPAKESPDNLELSIKSIWDRLGNPMNSLSFVMDRFLQV